MFGSGLGNGHKQACSPLMKIAPYVGIRLAAGLLLGKAFTILDAATVNQPVAGQPNDGMAYAIQAGDTLSSIARKNGVTIEDLQAGNPDINPATLKIGQLIFVPPPAVVIAANSPAGQPAPPAGTNAPSPALTKGLHFATGPADAPALVLARAREVLPDSAGLPGNPNGASAEGIDRNTLTVLPPLAAYALDPHDFAKGLGLTNAEKLSDLDYIVESPRHVWMEVRAGTNKIGQTEVEATTHSGGPLDDIYNAIRKILPESNEVRNGSFELRMLAMSPDNRTVLWLKALDGGADLLYPIPFPDDNLPIYLRGRLQPKLYTVKDFASAYGPVVTHEFPILKPASSGPDLTASPTAVADAFPPSSFEGKQTILGPANDLLNELWPGNSNLAIFASSEGFRIAWIGADGGKFHVFVNGVPGPGFDEILRPRLSSDGQHVTYKARPQKAIHQEQVVVDGTPGSLFYYVETFEFSPDGQHLAYVAENPNQQRQLVLDGKLGPEYDDIFGFYFSPDSQHLAYEVEVASSKKSETDRVIFDGAPGSAFEDITNIIFSPDSKHLAYIATSGNHQQVVYDGTPGPVFDEIRNGSSEQMAFSSDSQHLSYIGVSGNRSQLIVDGTGLPGYFVWEMPVHSPDGKHEAFIAASEDDRSKFFLVFDGKSAPLPAGTRASIARDRAGTAFPFSPDSSHFAYLVGSGGKYRAVVDGVPGPEYDGPTDRDTNDGMVTRSFTLFQFSPDSQHTALLAKKGDNWQVVVDGKPGVALPGFLHFVTFSPDGNRIAYAAQRYGGAMTLIG